MDVTTVGPLRHKEGLHSGTRSHRNYHCQSARIIGTVLLRERYHCTAPEENIVTPVSRVEGLACAIVYEDHASKGPLRTMIVGHGTSLAYDRTRQQLKQ